MFLVLQGAVALRHRLYDWHIFKSESFDIPVVCVGNITVGGTGKTPAAEYIIAHLSDRYNIALLSRGYGRHTKGYREVKRSSSYLDAGDEPLQIKLKFPDVPVIVCEKRAEGIRRIRREHPEVDLIVMDDGFQHRSVAAKVNVIIVDATRPVSSDKMLPAGSLRDIPSRLRAAHHFIVTKCPDDMTPLDQRIWAQAASKQTAFQKVYFAHTSAADKAAVRGARPRAGRSRLAGGAYGRHRQSARVQARHGRALQRGRHALFSATTTAIRPTT